MNRLNIKLLLLLSLLYISKGIRLLIVEKCNFKIKIIHIFLLDRLYVSVPAELFSKQINQNTNLVRCSDPKTFFSPTL